MASPSQNRTLRLYHAGAEPLTPGLVAAAWALATATFFLVGMLVFPWLHPLAAIVISQVIAMGLVPVALVHVRGGPSPWRALGLGRAPLRAIAGAALVGACVWYVELRLAAPIVEAMRREQEVEALTRAILGDGAPLLAILAASALVPAVCEELLYRGLLLPGLVASLGRVGGVLACSGLFALVHLEPARMASSFVLGTMAGALAVGTRSLWPAITVHGVNNAAALAVATSGGDPVSNAIAAHPDVALTVMLAGTFAGLAIATWANTARSDQS